MYFSTFELLNDNIFDRAIFHLFIKAVTFTPPIFHPSVNPETGELDVKRAFKTWR